MKLKLSDIDITDLQARAGTDDKTITEYAEAWKEGEQFPPAVVFHDGKNYFLADGFHRYFGAKRAGLVNLFCDVRKGSRKDALWFAVGANRTHGLKRTAADKRRAVELALGEKPEMADNAIAKHVGVSFALVKDVRSHLRVREGESSNSLGKSQNHLRVREGDQKSEVPKRTGLDGKKYPTPPTSPPKKHPPVPTSKSHPKPPPKTEEPTDVLDKTGWPIPAKILKLWDRTSEVQALLTTLSQVKGALREAQKEKDKLFAEVNFSSVLSHLDQAWSDIQTAKPFAVCTTCQGQLADNCVLCKGRGFISELRWNMVVPKEIKELRAKARKAA